MSRAASVERAVAEAHRREWAFVLAATVRVARDLDLARMLRELMPAEREVRGLLALLLVTDARRSTRTDAQGRLLLLEEQDRSACCLVQPPEK